MHTLPAAARPEPQETLALALLENLQRVNLSHAERVAALEQLAELSHARGLRHTARLLRVDPSWLSRQLAVRRDPPIFRAFASGQLSVGQAAELLRAPAQQRQFLLHRVTRSSEHVPVATIRAWVDQARAGTASSAEAASAGASSRYRRLLNTFKHLQPPTTDDDRAALRELLQVIQRTLGPAAGAAPPAPHERATDWIDLACLLCGEHARAQQVGNRLRLADPGALRQAGGRLVCGRCGGSVAPSERGRQYTY